MLKDNITGTLGNHICAYWRAAFSCKVNNDMWHQCSTEQAKNITMVLSTDDFVGKSLPKNATINTMSPYLFSYCNEHAQNGSYQVMFGKLVVTIKISYVVIAIKWYIIDYSN